MITKKTLTALILGCAVFVIQAAPTNAAAARPTRINIYNAETMVVEKSFLAFPTSIRNGATVAVGKVLGDGKNYLIVGEGSGGKSLVRIFQSDGTQKGEFTAYDQSFKGGVKVASCDLNNDGTDEIITGPGQGTGPSVRIYNASGTMVFGKSFNAFTESFRGGVNVACGDVDGDGTVDIVAGIGSGSSPKVKIFSADGADRHLDIVPYAQRDRGGVAVAVGNVDGGKSSEIITSIYRFGRSQVKVYKANAARSVLSTFEGWAEDFQGGFQIAAGDINGDRRADVAVGIGVGDTPQFRVFTSRGMPLSAFTDAYEKSFTGGVNLAVGDVDNDGMPEVVTAPGVFNVNGGASYQKYIMVNLREQRLYAFEKGKLVRTFLVSTGIKKYPTPPGVYAVTAKVPKKDYEWSYGENHPDNYDIKDVQWNLRFAPTLYLHYAFWHNNFGHVMSHGCVNINKANAEWIYNWADVGVPVIINGPQPFKA